jgi:general stress protein YciG
LTVRSESGYYSSGEFMKDGSVKKNPHAVALGRNGGKARKIALSPERRSEIARKAGTTHWDRVRAAKAAAKPKRRGRKAAA